MLGQLIKKTSLTFPQTSISSVNKVNEKNLIKLIRSADMVNFCVDKKKEATDK